MKLSTFVHYKASKVFEGLGKFLKITSLALACIMAVSVVGCKDSADNVPTPPTSQTENPSDSGIDNPTNPDKEDSGTDDPTVVIPVEKINNLVTMLDEQSYTYKVTEPTQGFTYLIEGTKFEIKKNAENFKMFDVSQEQPYVFEFKDGKWNKDFCEECLDIDGLIKSPLETAEWTSYDEETKVFAGVMGGQGVEVTLNQAENGATFEYEDGKIGDLFDLSATKVEFPTNFVDNTKPAVMEKDFYQIVDGEYVFNVKFLSETLDAWMKDSGYVGMYVIGKNRVFDKMIYVNPTLDSFNFGGLVTNFGSEKAFQKFKLSDKTLLEGIKNGTIKTEEQFKNWLISSNKPFEYEGSPIKYEYTTENYTAEQKAEFDVMTTNIFNRLSTVGYQGSSVKNEGTVVEGLENAKVLFAFKTFAGEEGAGLDLGYMRSWNHYYLIKTDVETKFIRVSIHSSTTNKVENEKVNVLNNNTTGNDGYGWWYCGYCEEIEKLPENLNVIYSNQIALNAEKGKEL